MDRVCRIVRGIVIFAIPCLLACRAWADCPSRFSLPIGMDGQLGYDGQTKDLYLCDGTTWRTLNSAAGAATTSVSSADCTANIVGSGSGQACCIGLECCITVNFPLAAVYKRSTGTALYSIPAANSLGGSIGAAIEISRPGGGANVDAATAIAAGLDTALMQEANKGGCGVAVKVCMPTLCTLGLCGGSYALNASLPFRRNYWLAGTGGYTPEQITDATGTYTVRTSGQAEIMSRDSPTVSYNGALSTPTAGSTGITHNYALTDTMSNVTIGNALNLVLEGHFSSGGTAYNLRGTMSIARIAYLNPACRR